MFESVTFNLYVSLLNRSDIVNHSFSIVYKAPGFILLADRQSVLNPVNVDADATRDHPW
jgi:hypothetical protein